MGNGRARLEGGRSCALADDASQRPIPRAVWLTASVMVLGGFLGNMDGSIVAVGLEAMRANLDASLEEIQWVATTVCVLAVTAAGWLRHSELRQKQRPTAVERMGI